MGILSALFGGGSSQQSSNSVSNSENRSESSSLSENVLLPYLQQATEGLVGQQGRGTNLLESLLGIGDPSVGQAGFDQYKNLAGFNFLNERGQGQITGTAAAKGLLNSGSTRRDLASFTSNLGSQMLNQYMSNVLGYSNTGSSNALNALQILAGAGQRSSSDSSSYGYSQSSSTSKGSSAQNNGGLATLIGAVLSDMRAKENIVKISEFEDGLGLYEFNYIGNPDLFIGVMAQEVAKLRPWALGPEVDGYMTVNYGRL